MFRTIQSKLFISYTSFVLLVILAFTSFFYIYTVNPLKKKASESLYTLSFSINNQLDSELKTMNSTITKIWYSQSFKELFYSQIYDVLNSDNLDKQRILNDIIYNAIGADFRMSQVNIFQTKGVLFSIGSSYRYTNVPKTKIFEIPWMQKVIDLNGEKLVIAPHTDHWDSSNNNVVSVAKAFSGSFTNQMDTVIEVQQDYKHFADIINKAIRSADPTGFSQKSVVVFNSEGQMVYPLHHSKTEKESADAFYLDTIKRHSEQIDNISVLNPQTKTKEILAYYQSEFSDWTVIVAEPENLLMYPTIQFRNTIIIASIVVLVLSLILSYLISRTLTRPIKRMIHNIRKISIEVLPPDLLQKNSDINEFDELNLCFSEMWTKLQKSFEELLQSRSHEMQAHFLALQSQMNPHFLYNIIANISVMAEENDDMEVVAVCSDISSMLRYISSDSHTPVSIEQELEHTLNFIHVMKVRYEDNIRLDIQVPDDMLGIMVPKLIIQPLVENCLKFAVHVDPPWRISIEGKCYDNRWYMVIRDNGTGFDDMFLNELQDRMSSIDLSDYAMKLKPNGMGLINIYVRLKLLYKSEAIFELSNHPDGGAVVMIGGLIEDA